MLSGRLQRHRHRVHVRFLERSAWSTAVIVVAALVACGSAASPTASSTSTVTPALSLPASAPPSSAPSSTAAASVDELNVVASLLYPACTPADCAGDALFTTCDASASGSDV